MAVQVMRRLFTVDEYYQMAEAGILSEDDRVELIEGEIVKMSPISARHAAAVDRLTQLFITKLRGAAIVRTQNPIHLNEYTLWFIANLCLKVMVIRKYARHYLVTSYPHRYFQG
jgi:hypothetical protein